ncbi:MAG: hypothetical protein AAGM22_26860 [Acidobacteriota bacterium]
MKAPLAALFVVLLISPMALAHVDLPSKASAPSAQAADSFFAVITPDFLRATLPSACTTGLDAACADVCFAKHAACAIAVCGQPCFTEPCLSELSDCLNNC